MLHTGVGEGEAVSWPEGKVKAAAQEAARAMGAGGEVNEEGGN